MSQETDFSQNIKEVFSFNKSQQKVNEVTVLKSTITRNNERALQILKDVSFLLDKTFHFILNDFYFFNAFQSIFIVRLILYLENQSKLSFTQFFYDFKITQFHLRNLLFFQCLKLNNILFHRIFLHNFVKRTAKKLLKQAEL